MTVIAASDAIIDPRAVMVKCFHTCVALGTVGTAGRTIELQMTVELVTEWKSVVVFD